jgi:Zn finger protein HypA/HybF involved in hydrogenase expression
MHEEALVRDLRRKLEELSRAHGSEPIVRARVAVGPLSHLDEPRLRELWSRTMVGGPAAHAELVVETPRELDGAEAASVVLRSVTFSEAEAGPPSPARRSSQPSPSSSGGP